MGWLKMNRERVLIGLAVALVAGLIAMIEGGAVKRTDARWQGAQATATVLASGAKAVTETAAGQAAARAEEKIDADIADVRGRAAALRERVRGAARGTSGAGVPDAAAPASRADDPAGGDIVVVEDRTEALTLQLIDVAEEGDVYRAQVLGWQAFWRELEAAWALGGKVKPPD